MSQQIQEAKGHEKLVANRFSVTTQGILCDKNKIATQKFCRDIIKVCRDRIQERAQRTGRDKRLHVTTKASDKD